MRLARYFGGDARSWLNLQAPYDPRLAEMANARKIEREIMPIVVLLRRASERTPTVGAWGAPRVFRAIAGSKPAKPAAPIAARPTHRSRTATSSDCRATP